MNNQIEVTPGEATELINLIGKYGTISDMYSADTIYEETRNIKANRGDERWAHLSGLANVLRIGYIMGQRAERERSKRAKATA